ncbi:MAG: hypothetical protein QOF01_4164 [Thermomicrobiales bacterium]|jgi:hypothetical protein|nr:hypothetical protein [Thermomicrobiales bacterium]
MAIWPFWQSKRSDKQTDALVQRMVQDWKVSPGDAREYVEGRGDYLRMKDVKKPDELKQFQRAKRWAAADGGTAHL